MFGAAAYGVHIKSYLRSSESLGKARAALDEVVAPCPFKDIEDALVNVPVDVDLFSFNETTSLLKGIKYTPKSEVCDATGDAGGEEHDCNESHEIFKITLLCKLQS